MQMTFGAYKDAELRCVPSSYLQWLLAKSDKASSKLKDAASAELAHRARGGTWGPPATPRPKDERKDPPPPPTPPNGRLVLQGLAPQPPAVPPKPVMLDIIEAGYQWLMAGINGDPEVNGNATAAKALLTQARDHLRKLVG